jgi:hypothetical protein
MANSNRDVSSRGWLVLAVFLIAFESIFVYEAMFADWGGFQKIFGVFAGLAILCFAALLYAVAVVLYGWEP